LLLAWGALWWLGAGRREIGYWLPRDAREVALLSLTAVAFAIAERHLAWPAAPFRASASACAC
jgi:hypothetical protein